MRRPGRPVRSSHRAAAPSATVPSSPTSSARPDLGEQGAGRRASEGGGRRRGPPRAALPSLYMYEAAQGTGDGPAAPASGDLHPGATKKGQAKEAFGKGRWRAGRARIGDHHAGPAARRASPALNIMPGADHGQGRGGTRSGEKHPGRSQRAPRLADSITPARRGRRHGHRATSRRHGRVGRVLELAPSGK